MLKEVFHLEEIPGEIWIYTKEWKTLEMVTMWANIPFLPSLKATIHHDRESHLETGEGKGEEVKQRREKQKKTCSRVSQPRGYHWPTEEILMLPQAYQAFIFSEKLISFQTEQIITLEHRVLLQLRFGTVVFLPLETKQLAQTPSTHFTSAEVLKYLLTWE